jgi:hypothetical protein
LHSDNTFTLNAGGWITTTTARRISTFSPVSIHQKEFGWYMSGIQGYDCPVPFVEGMRVTSDGTLIGYDLAAAQQNVLHWFSGWDRLPAWR